MDAKQIVGSTVELLIKGAVFVLIVMFIYRTAVSAYDYGYRVFAEGPVSEGEGRTLSVYVEEDDSVQDIGKMLQEKGLIRDAKLFWMQELLSENHGKINPGIYDLNTAMTSQEMIAVMSENTNEGIEEDSEETLEGGLQEGESTDAAMEALDEVQPAPEEAGEQEGVEGE